MRILLLLLLAACGGKATPPPTTTPPKPEQAKPVETPSPVCTSVACVLPVIEKYSAEMCACSDKGCADAVNNRFTQWSADLAKDAPKEQTQPSEDETKRLTESVTRYSDCYTNLAMQGTGDAKP